MTISIGQRANFAKKVRQGLLLAKRERPQQLSEWADANFYLSSEGSYTEGRWNTEPHQRDIMDCISNDDIYTIDIKKSARLGISKVIIAASLYGIQHKRRNVLYYREGDMAAKRTMKVQFETAIRDVPIVKDLAPWANKKHPNSTLDQKIFTNGKQLLVYGGATGNRYRDHSVDLVCYDELSAFPLDVDGEGEPTLLGDKRLEGSYFPKSIRVSTPKLRSSCQITRAISHADYVFNLEIPCPHCDHYQPLQFGGKDASFGLKIITREPQLTVEYLCCSCGALFDQQSAQEAQAQGVWRSHTEDEDGNVIGSTSIRRDDFNRIIFRNDKDELIDTPAHIGFEIWTAYSPWAPWPKIMKDFLRAKNDPLQLKGFANTTLGEDWDDEPESKVDPTSLIMRREHYSADVPDGVYVLTAGVDTQDDRLEFEIVGWGKDEESWSIDYGRLFGDPSKPEIWNRLQEQLLRNFQTSSNQILNIKMVCIDAGGHYSDEVRKFAKKGGAQWLVPIMGRGTAGHPIAKFPRKKNDRGVYQTYVGMTASTEIVYQRWSILEVGPGYCHFPNKEEYNEDLFAQFTAERLTRSFKSGKEVMTWDNGSRRNEASDCRRYAFAAVRILQQHRGITLDKPLANESKASRKPPSRETRYRTAR